MAWWRKKSDGFDWHAYVRTTIKLRREERRARLEDIRGAVVERAGQARDAVAAGSVAAGASALTGLRRIVATLLSMAITAYVALETVLWRTLSPAGRRIGSGYGKVAASEGARSWLLIALAVCAMVLVSLAWRIGTLGLDVSAIWAIAIVALVAVLALPALVGFLGLSLPPRLAAILPNGPRLLTITLGAGIAGGSWLYYVSPHLPSLAPTPSSQPTASTAAPRPAGSSPVSAALSGRATVLDGQTLRIDGVVVRLSGIDAPERAQRCTRAGRPWRCGELARTALERITRGKQVRCSLSSRDDGAGKAVATCTVEAMDLADHLVRQGHVFSSATLFGGYASAEREARSAGRGLWSGEAERPSEFRTKKWDEARATAPEGCPIKGVVTGAGRNYVMPWASDYSSRKVRVSRGERWFCSERDAAAAGFKPSARS